MRELGVWRLFERLNGNAKSAKLCKGREGKRIGLSHQQRSHRVVERIDRYPLASFASFAPFAFHCSTTTP